MSADFADFLRRDVRLVLLRILSELPGYAANSSVLANLLDQMGHRQTREAVKDDLRFLAGENLVTLETAQSVLLATLTERGQEIVEGRLTVSGVARPKARAATGLLDAPKI
ncbi:MAG: ArsR family transcriptional regulator [Zoogloeaceae bacterium]|jgi:hypothetical protein|nr:ArsR family transcriptional regulator [Zoogloeaceae bacterium]